MKNLLRQLYDKPMTQPEIMEATGLTNSTVSRWLRLLHVHPGIVYISGWRRVGERGNYSAVWSAGFWETDALKPKPMTMSEYNKRWRKNQLVKSTRTKKGIEHDSSSK